MSSITLTRSKMDLIIATARSWLGTPYEHQGRLKGHACDCLGLIVGVANELKITSFDTLRYSEDPNPRHLKKGLDEQMDSVYRADGIHRQDSLPRALMPSDVIVINWRNQPRHLGILTKLESGGIGLIHAYTQVGQVVEHSLDKIWLWNLEAGYRYRWPH